MGIRKCLDLPIRPHVVLASEQQPINALCVNQVTSSSNNATTSLKPQTLQNQSGEDYEQHHISLVGSIGNPYIDMKINHVPIKGMIDTGASRSVITTAAVVTYLGAKVLKELTAVRIKLTAANGEQLKVLGQIEAHLKIGSTEFQHPLIVFANKKCEFLIGNDILIDRFNVVQSRYISPARRLDERIPIQYMKKTFPASVKCQYAVPPNSTMEVQVSTEPHGET